MVPASGYLSDEEVFETIAFEKLDLLWLSVVGNVAMAELPVLVVSECEQQRHVIALLVEEFPCPLALHQDHAVVLARLDMGEVGRVSAGATVSWKVHNVRNMNCKSHSAEF